MHVRFAIMTPRPVYGSLGPSPIHVIGSSHTAYTWQHHEGLSSATNTSNFVIKDAYKSMPMFFDDCFPFTISRGS
jgi:hypothetical protein